MRFEVDGSEVYASTGGRDHIDGQDWLIFMHGSGASHVVFSQQSRSFAYGGYNVLAIDFPGHNMSGGEPLTSIEAQGEWIIKVMDTLGIKTASFVGHSQGGLVCLEVSRQAPDRLDKLIFVATAAAIPVNDMLIDMSQNKQDNAKASMTAWGTGPDAHHFSNSVPGFSTIGGGLRLMDLNDQEALTADLKACAAYDGGLEVASNVTCESLCVLAKYDKMTPLKFGLKLADALSNNTTHVIENAGHTIPVEAPIELNAYMREFLGK